MTIKLVFINFKYHSLFPSIIKKKRLVMRKFKFIVCSHQSKKTIHSTIIPNNNQLIFFYINCLNSHVINICLNPLTSLMEKWNHGVI